nr:MAG TPA: hypothetical protein [Caudoviricetes sp.]
MYDILLVYFDVYIIHIFYNSHTLGGVESFFIYLV